MSENQMQLQAILDSFKASNEANKDQPAEVQFSNFVAMVSGLGDQTSDDVKAPLTNLMVLHLQSQFSNFAETDQYKHLASLGNQAEVDSVRAVFSSQAGDTEAALTAINPVYGQSYHMLGDDFYQLHSTLQAPAAVHEEV
jgi:hypothetical protein